MRSHAEINNLNSLRSILQRSNLKRCHLVVIWLDQSDLTDPRRYCWTINPTDLWSILSGVRGKCLEKNLRLVIFFWTLYIVNQHFLETSAVFKTCSCPNGANDFGSSFTPDGTFPKSLTEPIKSIWKGEVKLLTGQTFCLSQSTRPTVLKKTWMLELAVT